MPTYRVTITDALGGIRTLEVHSPGALILTSGKDPSQLKDFADKEKRGAVVINVPLDMLTKAGVEIKAEALPPKVTVYLSDDEKRMLIGLVNDDTKMSAVKNMHLLKTLSKKGFVTWSAKDGWQTTKDGRDRAGRLVAHGFKP